jgi:hypothetical protein
MSAAKNPPSQQQLAWRRQVWCRLVGDMSGATFYRERAAGIIRTIKIGSSTRVITPPEEYIAAKIAAQAAAGEDATTRRSKELVEIRRAKHSTTLRHRRLSEATERKSGP